MKIDNNLRSFGTVRQNEILDALEKHKTQRKAAAALGLAPGTIQNTIERLQRKASLKGWAPEYDMTRTVPSAFNVKGVSTYYNKDGKPSGQWVKSQIDADQREQVMRDFVESIVQDIKGMAPVIPAPKFSDDDLMCVYPMGDPHFGMHAWWADAGDDFDLKIAEELTCSAIDRLVACAPPSKTALMLNLGDMFHADNQKNTTNSGHQLDVDGRWAKVQQVGLRAMLHCINRLLEKHQNVIFRINKGNHDGHSSYALALMISCYYHKEPRVDVDLSPNVMWYYQFGLVLFGSTHGDEIKADDMLPIMACDMPKAWGETQYRYVYVGHIHHKFCKEYRGGIVEYFRTLAARDAWHTGKGYRAGRDMNLIVHHRNHGEIERHVCDVGMIKGNQ